MTRLYKILSNFFFLPILFYFVLRFFRSKETSQSIKEKFCYKKILRPRGKLIWVNAVSIGETLSALSILKKIKKEYPKHIILLTTSTLSSAEIIKQRFSDNVIHQFAPIDVDFLIKKFIQKWSPDLVIFLESEIWPNVLNSLNEKKIKIILLNARMSETSFKIWSKFPKISQSVFQNFDRCFAQDIKTSVRLKKLGVKNVKKITNLKFATEKLPVDNKELNFLNKFFVQKKIILLASSHKGEEELLIKIFKKLKEKYFNLLLIIAPRHITRRKEIIKILQREKIEYALKSTKKEISSNSECFIADTFGEMGILYKLSDIVIIGGSFINRGGQNPIEASDFKCSVIIGPHYDNFYEIVEILKREDAIIQVKNKKELMSELKSIISDNKKLLFSQNKLNETVKKQKKSTLKIWQDIKFLIEQI